MLRNSTLYRTISPEKIAPLDMGGVLSIHNNSFHPHLNVQGATDFLEAHALIEHSLAQLLPLVDLLKKHPIRINEFSLALNYLNSYIYILQVTLDIPQNLRMQNYALNAKAGAK